MKNNRSHVFPAQWVFGGICRETGESFMYAVADRSAATLVPIIQASVRPGTTRHIFFTKNIFLKIFVAGE